MYTVYMHTTPSNKVYIGITARKPEQRWDNGNGYRNNKHFYSAIRLYKWENIKHEILETGLTKEQACAKEIELIAKYDSTNPDKGYNNSTGGECIALGVHFSAERRRKISESLKRIYLDPELRKKLSETNKGANNPNYDKHFSADHRRKISESNKGKNTKAVICVETGTLYSSVTEAAESIGVTHGAISMVINGVHKTAGGYHWKYVES